MPPKIAPAAFRHDPDCSRRQVAEQKIVRVFQVEHDCPIVGRFHLGHAGVGGGLWGDDRSIAHRIDGPDHIESGHLSSIMEAHAVAQMKDPS